MCIIKPSLLEIQDSFNRITAGQISLALPDCNRTGKSVADGVLLYTRDLIYPVPIV